MAGEGAAPPPRRARILEWLEVFAKLLGASAVVLVALFANSLQSKITGVSIQSQREQAESQLRASMFNSLVSPLVGPQTADKPMPADREVVLTELLALNFNENFEMKPLLEDANKRLAAEQSGKSSKDGEDPREALWSIARTIAERQKATISREWSSSTSAQASSWFGLGSLVPSWISSANSTSQGCEVYYLTLDEKMDHHDEAVTATDCQAAATFGDTIDLKSPDGNYTLRMVLVHPNWTDQTVKVSAQAFLSKQTLPKATDTQYNFELSWLDLPLTDNTILSDGNRFAVYLRTFYGGTVNVNVMWFPKGYFTPRERPLNYNDVQTLLGTSQK
jgi:hypothetical protein